MTDKPESHNNVLRLATRRDRASDVPRTRRAGNVVLANELQAPLAALIRTLQRLGLQRITGADDPSPKLTQLIARGRDLATELQVVVDEIVGVTGPEPDGADRSQQETVRFGELVDSVRTIVAGSIDLERLTVRRDHDIAITTNPGRFVDLLADVLLVASNETDGPLAIVARATRSDIEVVVTWSDDVEHDHGRAPEELPALLRSRTLARSLGGVLHATTIGRETSVVLVLPQQRARDRRPPDGPDRPIA
ncbi:MAG: hypothetical protein U0V73_07035 [Acidimicrobiia bacterium]